MQHLTFIDSLISKANKNNEKEKELHVNPIVETQHLQTQQSIPTTATNFWAVMTDDHI